MNFLIVICVGLFVGIMAKLFMSGIKPDGLILTILLGIGGAMAASYVGLAIKMVW